MRNKLLCFILMILFLIGSTSAWAESLLTVDPLSQDVFLGNTASVDVSISGATDLYGWQFSLGYDGTILSLLSVSAGPFIGTGGSTFWGAPSTGTPGEILSGYEILSGAIPGVNGSGTLLSLNFNTIASGTSAIDIYIVDADPGLPTEMSNSSGSPISFSATNGSVTVVVPEPIRSVFFIIGGAVFGGILYRNRKKQNNSLSE